MSAGLKTALLFVAALLAQQAPTVSPRADGTIAGQVVDAATGKPLGAAAVALFGPGPPTERNPPRSVLTGSDGRFVFSNLQPGDFGLTVVRAGYLERIHGQRRPYGEGQRITLRAGERHDAALRLFKLAVISGTVIDEAGEPVIGAQIRVWRRCDGRRTLSARGMGSTDDRGYYRISNLPAGDYVVGTGERHVAVPHAWSERAFPTVRQPPGKPGTANAIAIGDQVVMVGRGGAIPPPLRGQRLFVYPPTFYPVAPTEHAAAPVKLELGGEQAGIDLQLQPVPTFRVAGRLISAHGTAGVTVRLSRAGVSSPTIDIGESITVSDLTGTFAFPTVAAGAYALRAMVQARVPGNPDEPIERGLWAELPVNVTSDIDDAVLTLEAGLRIVGRLEFDGTRPAPAADRFRMIRLEIFAAQPDQIPVSGPTTRMEPTGSFTSIGLPRGRYYVRVGVAPEGWVLRSVTLNGRDMATTPLDLSRGDVTGVILQFTDRPATIAGTVRASDASDGTATVLLFPTDSDSWRDFSPDAPGFRSVRTNPAGMYAINDVAPGSYYVVAIPDESSDTCEHPDFFERLSPSATLISVAEGERRVVDLRTVSIK